MRRFQELTVAVGCAAWAAVGFKNPPGQCASCTKRAGWNLYLARAGRA